MLSTQTTLLTFILMRGNFFIERFMSRLEEKKEICYT